jgi:hypothetical protein
VQFHSPDKRAANRPIAQPTKPPPRRNAPPPPSPSRSVATSHGSRPTCPGLRPFAPETRHWRVSGMALTPAGGRMAMPRKARAASGASGINRRSGAGSRRPPAVGRDPERAAATRSCVAVSGTACPGLRPFARETRHRRVSGTALTPPKRPHGGGARRPRRVRGFRD